MRGLWINNAFVDSSTDDVLSVVDPAAEEVVEEVQAGGAADVNRAVQAAHAAAPGWRRTPAVERAALLRHVAERLREQREELARLLTRETGRTLIKNRGYVDFSADAFAFYAELGRNERGRVVASPEPTQLSLVLHEPHGVVACIVPWNYPLLLLSWKVAPALAAGNTVVIKPVTQAPLTTLKLAECLTTCRPACEAVLRRGASRQHRDQRPASGQRSRAIWRFQIERRRPRTGH